MLFDKDKKTYPLSWVVMQNSIQECFKSMSIGEKRLLILASPIARTTNATEKDSIMITAESFAQECNIKTHSAYKSLVDASKALIKRYFCYLDEKGCKTYCNWVIRARYEDGTVSMCFPDEVLLMLKEFDKLNPYTKYKKDIVLKLKLDYSFDFYHLAKKHQAMGAFEMSLEHIKNELGLPKSYDKLSNLKERVINPSLEEITANTDIEVSYENVKQGRSVVGFKFIVKEKTKEIKSSGDKPMKLTEKQITTYANKLCQLHELSDLAGNMDYPVFATWIASILRDPTAKPKAAKRIFQALQEKTDFYK